MTYDASTIFLVVSSVASFLGNKQKPFPSQPLQAGRHLWLFLEEVLSYISVVPTSTFSSLDREPLIYVKDFCSLKQKDNPHTINSKYLERESVLESFHLGLDDQNKGEYNNEVSKNSSLDAGLLGKDDL